MATGVAKTAYIDDHISNDCLTNKLTYRDLTRVEVDLSSPSLTFVVAKLTKIDQVFV